MWQVSSLGIYSAVHPSTSSRAMCQDFLLDFSSDCTVTHWPCKTISVALF